MAITNVLTADRLIPSSKLFKSSWVAAFALPFATSLWPTLIRMLNTRRKPPKQRARKENSGRCTICYTRIKWHSMTKVSRLIGEVLSGAHMARVREDFQSGARGGVNGTPSFFINGVRHDGAPSFDALLAALVGA